MRGFAVCYPFPGLLPHSKGASKVQDAGSLFDHTFQHLCLSRQLQTKRLQRLVRPQTSSGILAPKPMQRLYVWTVAQGQVISRIMHIQAPSFFTQSFMRVSELASVSFVAFVLRVLNNSMSPTKLR
jgi:hypothetical protein